MRTLFWILLLVNITLFAVMRQGGLGVGEQAYQPQPALNADKIRLIEASQNLLASQVLPASQNSATKPMREPLVPTIPVSAPVPSVLPSSKVPVATPGLAVSSVPVRAAQMRAATSQVNTITRRNPVCLEWGDFSGTDLKRATETLSAMQLGDRLGQREIQYDKGYWVYIPPLKNKAAANKKIAQLRKLGIKEYFVVQDGPLRLAISLGVFKTKDAAEKYLNELQAKDMRGIKIGERASKLKTTVFVLNNVDAAIEGRLAATKKDFPGSELKNVPCALTR